MTTRVQGGFSMIELMVVLVISGLLLAVSLPAFMGYTQSNDVKSAAHSIAGQIAAARERAISTGNTQTIRFIKDFQSSSDYHIWDGTTAAPSWRLPRSVSYLWSTGTQNTFRMTTDGRCLDNGLVILQGGHGDRDTVSVRLSGLVIAY